jgi:hypothetical protein
MTWGLPSRHDYSVADPSSPVSAASVVHPLDPGCPHLSITRRTGPYLSVWKVGRYFQPHLYQNVKSAVRQRRPRIPLAVLTMIVYEFLLPVAQRRLGFSFDRIVG